MMDYHQRTAYTSPMAKFIFSVGDGNFRLLATEAKARDITIQELIRAVIIPDWMKLNLDSKTLREATSLLAESTALVNQRPLIIPSPIGRLKT